MEINAFAIYNWKTVKKFNNFHNFKKNKFKKAMPIILIIAILISFIGTSICYAFGELDSFLISLIIIEILAVFLLLFKWFIMPRINFNINKVSKNNKNEYIFKDNVICISSETNGMNSNSEIDYKKFHSVYETKDFFYFYISMNQAFIVEKDSILGGSFEELRIHLLETVGEKRYKLNI